MGRPLFFNRYFWAGLCLLMSGFYIDSSLIAQLHQPFQNQPVIDSAKSSFQMPNGASQKYFEPYQGRVQRNSLINQRPNRVMPVSNFQPENQYLPTGQLPPAPAEFYPPNSALRQPAGSTVPPIPRTFPNAGGHTFEPTHNLPPLAPPQSDSLYNSPYNNGGGHSYSAPGQSLPYTTQPQECIDCFDGHYNSDSAWGWTVLPKDLLYQSYLGGPREPRFAQGLLYLKGTGMIWALEAGGRAGILRYGSGPGEPLEGWQFDIWGAAFPRLNMNENSELDAADFKVGFPLTYSKGPVQLKFEWNHISSHLGDEFMLRNPGFNRIEYFRDSFLLGGGYFVNPDWRLYADAEYSFNRGGGSEPWHFQFGVDYSPVCTAACQPVLHPKPFFAVNGHIREEANFSGGINVVAGLQWRSDESASLFRVGFQYYQGQSLQYEFINDYEELFGFGVWYDF